MFGVELGFGLAVGTASCDREDLDARVGGPSMARSVTMPRRSLPMKRRSGWTTVGESKNQISRRRIDVAKLIGKDVLGKHKVKEIL